MALQLLQEILTQANEALEHSGPRAIAERLLLFPTVVRALQQFVDREALRLNISRNVRQSISELDAELRAIEMAISNRGPSQEHVTRYYAAVNRLQKELKDLDKANQSVTVFNPIGE